ncbi:MAG: GTP-binding protein [Gemmatimonadales bacterium]
MATSPRTAAWSNATSATTWPTAPTCPRSRSGPAPAGCRRDRRHGRAHRSRQVGAGDGADRPRRRSARGGAPPRHYHRTQLRAARLPGRPRSASSTYPATRISSGRWWHAARVDLALLVIDAAEGPRPQTEEHLTILEQLRIPAAIPVFTKADLVDRDWVDLVVAELEPRLARSPVRFGAPAVVSAVTGDGVEALRERIAAAADEVRRDRSGARFRMPVDRVFSVAGVGTVVTGTTWAGTLPSATRSGSAPEPGRPGSGRSRPTAKRLPGRNPAPARPSV